MNGRVYDYNVARFLSVDPFIHGTGSQGITPYSYILNNPLAGTDPTGYSPECGPSGVAICQSEGEPKDDQEKPEVAGVIIEKVKRDFNRPPIII